MEHSRSKLHAGLAAVLVALDLVARLSLPAALLALAHGRAASALTASVAVTAAAGLRGILFGWVVERALADKWRRLINAARRMPPSMLKIQRQERNGLIRLIEAVREAAIHEAQATPHLISLAVALVAVLTTVIALLGPLWILLGGVVALVVGGVVLLGQRRSRDAIEQAWSLFGEVSRDMLILFEASTELRAHAREEALRAELVGDIDAMARAERRSTAWSALNGLLPAGIALIAVIAPFHAETRALLAGLGIERFADIGILGGAGLVIGFGFARAFEESIRSRPYRRALAAFIARSEASPEPPAEGSGSLPPSLASAEIRFEQVSCVHPGAAYATPANVDFCWKEPGGLALSGDNGAGKSTLLLALLGLITPAHGRITVGGVPLGQIDLNAYRRRITYVPQGAYTAAGESIAWHLRLLAGGEITDAQIDEALDRAGLLPALAAHALRAGTAPRDVLAGELSGGERQRMHLSRVFLTDPELILLDEPEVGLDLAGRTTLRRHLEELAAERRILVIAHDDAVIPASFTRIRCARGAAPLTASAPPKLALDLTEPVQSGSNHAIGRRRG